MNADVYDSLIMASATPHQEPMEFIAGDDFRAGDYCAIRDGMIVLADGQPVGKFDGQPAAKGDILIAKFDKERVVFTWFRGVRKADGET